MPKPGAAVPPGTRPAEPLLPAAPPAAFGFAAAFDAAARAVTRPSSAHSWQVTKASCQGDCRGSEAGCRSRRGDINTFRICEQKLKNSKCQKVVLDSRKCRTLRELSEPTIPSKALCVRDMGRPCGGALMSQSHGHRLAQGRARTPTTALGPACAEKNTRV